MGAADTVLPDGKGSTRSACESPFADLRLDAVFDELGLTLEDPQLGGEYENGTGEDQ